MEQQRLLSTSEAADFLGVSASYLRKTRLDGSGPVFARLGAKRVAYDPNDLASWVGEHKRRSTADRRQAVL